MSDFKAENTEPSPAPNERRDVGETAPDVQAVPKHSVLQENAAEAREAVRPDTDLEALRAQLEEANQQNLRAQAELENFRKRMRREMEEERRYAGASLIRDLLGVMDNMQRAIEAAEKADDAAGLLTGVKMVARQFADALERHHCQSIQSVGTEFDPHLHEAIGKEPSEEHDANVVTREARAGYHLHDRVIRPAQVFVSTGPATGNGPTPSDKTLGKEARNPKF